MLESMNFHHIGIATKSIDKTSKYYLEAGYNMSKQIFDPVQKVNIVFLSKKSMPMIELLEPACEDSPVSKILMKSGVGPYHICYQVKNIDFAIDELKKKKYISLFNPVEAIALSMKKICFLFNKNIGLIELVEE
jgi:methylmalonyl-CoA/ethylmalonyl-CoA epimerase